MDKIIDIQKGHTYSDYRRFFGDEYDRGKILGFELDQYKYMNPERQYWELKDENGKVKYYELPKHVKPFTKFSPYCFNRILHRRPARIAMLIVATIGVGSITSSFVAQKIFGSKNFDVIVVPAELDKAAIAYAKWVNIHGVDADISKDPEFKVCDIANMAMGNFLYTANATLEEATLRDKALTVGRGHNDTTVLLTHVVTDISNSFTQFNSQQLEESISYGTMSLTRFGKRDYFNELSQNEVRAYHGEAISYDKADWKDQLINQYTKEEYMNVAGKDPSQPFLYNINKDTVLTDTVYDENPETGEKHFGKSNCASIKDEQGNIKGYKIELDLHNILSVTRYVKRMKYLSGQTPNRFNSVHMTFETDKHLVLKSSYVNEDYVVTLMPSTGWFKTKYYVDDECPSDLHILNKTESFDYSKYQF